MSGIKNDGHLTEGDRDHEKDHGSHDDRKVFDDRMRRLREEVSGGTIMPDGNSSPGPIPPDTW